MRGESNPPTCQNQENEDPSHVIDISSNADKWINDQKMEDQIREPPKLLMNTAGKRCCCIFRVPDSLAKINEKAYEPQVVSVGPYHQGKKHLQMVQEHKWRFLGALLNRTKRRGVGLGELFKAIAPKEKEIRESYSEHIEFGSHKLMEIMVVDGCFIIELLCIVGRLVHDIDLDDPIFSLNWMLSFLTRDLLRLENQIPFFVLESLFELVRDTLEDTTRSLKQVALEFFDYAIERPKEVLDRCQRMKSNHLLDLFRSTFIPAPPHFLKRLAELLEKPKEDESSPSPFLSSIQSAKKLRLSGIKFMPIKTDTLLDINFTHGILKIPPLMVDDITTSFLLNCVAYEQCYRHCSKHFTSYIAFMGRLINTPEDAGYLGDHNIIENSFGTDDDVAKFFNDIGKDISFDMENSYLSEVFEDVNRYYRNYLHIQWAELKHTYFDSPWSFMSAMAALILLVLTIVQSFFAVYPYASPEKEGN